MNVFSPTDINNEVVFDYCKKQYLKLKSANGMNGISCQIINEKDNPGLNCAPTGNVRLMCGVRVAHLSRAPLAY